jgi:hypothetical protein
MGAGNIDYEAFRGAPTSAAPAAPAKAPAASANGARPYPGRELNKAHQQDQMFFTYKTN